MMKKHAAVILTGILALSLPFTASAKENNAQKTIHYVALGDSLAAGQTPYNRIMDKGYPDFIEQHFEKSQYQVEYENFGVSGYTSVQLNRDVLFNTDVREEIKEASHITIDIGANDLLPVLKRNPENAAKTIFQITMNIQSILTEIDKLNPAVDVLIMGYYNPFPHYPQAQQDQLMPVLDYLNLQIQYRALANGDTYIPTKERIAANEEKYLPNPADIHLSLEGYKAISQLFITEILSHKNK